MISVGVMVIILPPLCKYIKEQLIIFCIFSCMYSYATKIIKLDIINGKSPIKIDRGVPVFLAHEMPRVPTKLGACGYVLGVSDGKAIVYVRGTNDMSSDLINALDTVVESDLVIHNSRALYILDRNCDIGSI